MLCWRAAWMADMEQPNEVEASMAKAFCPAIAQEATIDQRGRKGAEQDESPTIGGSLD